MDVGEGKGPARAIRRASGHDAEINGGAPRQEGPTRVSDRHRRSSGVRESGLENSDTRAFSPGTASGQNGRHLATLTSETDPMSARRRPREATNGAEPVGGVDWV